MQKLATALVQRPLFSVREVIGNFEKMLKPRVGQEIYPFFITMRQWWQPQHKGGVRKRLFPCLGVSFGCLKNAQRHTTFLS